MNPELFEIARSKTSNKQEQETIEELLFLARAIHGLTMLMPSIITACKVMRGEKPPKYSKSKQSEIDEYGNDALEMDKESIARAKKTETAVAILGPIYFAEKCSIDSALDFLKYFKKGELDIAEVVISLRKTFIDKMEVYLPQYNGTRFIAEAVKFSEIQARRSNKNAREGR
jgi:hypothetical protein